MLACCGGYGGCLAGGDVGGGGDGPWPMTCHVNVDAIEMHAARDLKLFQTLA